jgi:hypothetical protein
VLVSCGLGWVAHAWWSAPTSAGPTVASGPGAGAAGSAPMWPAPFQSPVTVLGDGRVTVHAEGVQASWLLEELARAAGVPQAAGAPAAAGAPCGAASNAPCAAGAPAGAETADLLRALREGSAEQRLAALARAEEEGIALPREELMRLAETDPSEQVRVTAFTTYVDELSNEDGPALRVALMRGLRSGSPAVQQEARRRLDELEEFERANPPRQQGR